MKTLNRIFVAGFILAVGVAAAQPLRYVQRDRDYGCGDSYGQYRGRGGIGVVQRAMSDLDRARSYRFVDGHERRHIESARHNLERFMVNWNRGRFDKDRLDGAIEDLNDLARADQVHPRERMMFARDRDALRDFRATGGGRVRAWRF